LFLHNKFKAFSQISAEFPLKSVFWLHNPAAAPSPPHVTRKLPEACAGYIWWGEFNAKASFSACIFWNPCQSMPIP
jgi:hypothetical protein